MVGGDRLIIVNYTPFPYPNWLPPPIRGLIDSLRVTQICRKKSFAYPTCHTTYGSNAGQSVKVKSGRMPTLICFYDAGDADFRVMFVWGENCCDY